MGDGQVQEEWLRCSVSPHYFIHNYCYVFDAILRTWIPFHLWDAQAEVLYKLRDNRLTIILKARQLGQTWLVLAYALWLMLFRSSAIVLLFSRRDDEAQELLRRLRGMYDRLPSWCKAERILVDNNHEWLLSNESKAMAFPTTAGDSYTATIAIVDEADLVLNLDDLMNAVKPTIDNGGMMVLLSRSNKDYPRSPFKRMYLAAKRGENDWAYIFLPWNAHPQRTQEWYEAQKRDVLSRTGSLDDLWQQYPSKDTEALAARTLDKRIPAPWVEKCYEEMSPLEESELYSIHPALEVFYEPEEYLSYVIGADPAEGNPTSDDSSITIMESTSAEEVARLSERIEPTVFAGIICQLALAYNNAEILVERNNHGHAVIGTLREMEDTYLNLMSGIDGKIGWQTTSKSKAAMYTVAADFFRDGNTILHSEETYHQIVSVEGASLKAPDGQFDDAAISYCLCLQALDESTAVSFTHQYVAMMRERARDRRLAHVVGNGRIVRRNPQTVFVGGIRRG